MTNDQIKALYSIYLQLCDSDAWDTLAAESQQFFVDAINSADADALNTK